MLSEPPSTPPQEKAAAVIVFNDCDRDASFAFFFFGSNIAVRDRVIRDC